MPVFSDVLLQENELQAGMTIAHDLYDNALCDVRNEINNRGKEGLFIARIRLKFSERLGDGWIRQAI